MPDAISLSRQERPIAELRLDLAQRLPFFWRDFSVTLTSTHLHAWHKSLFSSSQKTVDLRDIDSVFQEKKSGILGALLWGFVVYLMTATFGVFAFVPLDARTPLAPMLSTLGGLVLGAAVFLLYMFAETWSFGHGTITWESRSCASRTGGSPSSSSSCSDRRRPSLAIRRRLFPTALARVARRIGLASSQTSWRRG
jgi:hypothetical protein